MDPDISQAAPETADIDTSSDDYATRFAGAVGEWMLEVQESITLQLLRTSGARTVLEVGGGHGQLAQPLITAGYALTVLGSDESCKRRISSLTDSGTCRFVTGNVIDLPFQDKSFDAVLAFRLLTHCRQWPILIKELCRVARHTVIIDYPTSQSLNVIAPALFAWKKKIEVNTRHWSLFRHREILDEFKKNSYQLSSRRAEFALPMVLHRMLKCRFLSTAMEASYRVCGLTRLLGSPVIIRMTRIGAHAAMDKPA